MAELIAARPLVTICITGYRRPTMATQCLLSCLAQDYRPLEIDISDDSPTDDTELAIKLVPGPTTFLSAIAGTRQASVSQGTSTACSIRHTVNFACSSMTTTFLLPGAVTALVEGILSTPKAVAAFGTHDVLLNSGEFCLPDTERTNKDFKRTPEHAGVMSDPLVSALWRQFPMNGYILETAAGRAVRYRTRKEIGGAGDTDFAIRLALTFPDRPFVFIDRPMSRYRVTIGGASSTMTGKALKLYQFLLPLSLTSKAQEQAREELLRDLCHQAVGDQALSGGRLEALKILFSKYYSLDRHPARAAYHLALIAFPGLHRLKLAFSRMRAG